MAGDRWILAAFSTPEPEREAALELARRVFARRGISAQITLAETDHLHRLQTQAAEAAGVLLPAPPTADPAERLVARVVVFDGEITRANQNSVFFNDHGEWLVHGGQPSGDPETGERFYLLVAYPATPSTPSGEEAP